MALASLKMDLDTYLTTNVLDTLVETFGKGYHHVDVIVVVIGVTGAVVATPGIGMACVFLYLWLFLVLSLLRAHLGYLHLFRAFLMCFFSLCSS